MTMWCRPRARKWSSSAKVSSRARSSGPRARSNGAAPIAAQASRTARSRRAASSPRCSSPGTSTGTASAMTGTGWPSKSGNAVRSTSWRRVSPVSTRAAPAGSIAPVSRSPPWMFIATSAGSERCSSHIRRCAEDSGSRPVRGTAGTRALSRPPEASALSTSCTRPSRCGLWRNSAVYRSMSNARQTAATSCPASSESPPET
ncbi:hypothetical protein CF54_16560 [Streptomyces sp. Tu 6176]|nr:hypothetical protein CF54_16560 [Streptomyces sp. Tu 6176]